MTQKKTKTATLDTVWTRHPGSIAAISFLAVILALNPGLTMALAALAQSDNSAKNLTWRSVGFAILRFNDEPPKSWNIYHSEKRGILLVRLWKRYLLVNVPEQQVYDLEPQKVLVQDEKAQWSFADLPEKPIETSEWKERNVGPVNRIRFRLGKDGPILDIQIPLGANGKPMY